MNGRGAGLLAAGAAAAFGGLRVVLAWGDLPASMASHFGADGRPDAFLSKPAFFGVFGGTFGVVVLALAVMPAWLRRIPDPWINLPNKGYWLQSGRREAAFARLGAWMTWMAAAFAVFAAGVLELVLRANLRRAPLENGPFIALLAVFFLAVGGLLAGLLGSFRIPPGGSAGDRPS